MKIRNSFVSNSSSSSFIVAFPKRPKSAKELQKMLFGEKQEFHSNWGDKFWTAKEVTAIVWHDLKSQKPMNLESVAKGITCGSYLYDYGLEFPHYSLEFGSDEYKEAWEQFRCKEGQMSKEHADKFLKKNPNTVVFRFEYSDNDGDLYSNMEHNDLFQRLPHIQIPNH